MRPIDFVFLGVLVLALIPIIVFDLRERRIPNIFNGLLAALGLARTAMEAPHLSSIAIALGQGAATLAVLYGTAWLMRRVRPDARIGGGDIKFIAAASFWVGFSGALMVLVVASLAAVVFAVAAAPFSGGVRWRELKPFAPMLAIGMLLITVMTFMLPPGSPAS